MAKTEKLTVEMCLGAVESAVEHIAEIRRMAELQGDVCMEDLDKGLNELCDKYHERYSKMSGMAIALHGMAKIIASGDGEEFLEQLMESMEGDE